jgi:uncharacterized protein (TIGR00251 family)
MECITELPDKSLSLHIYVQPRASRNRLAGMHGKAVKLCVTAPPVDDRANTAVLAYLAKFFGLPKSALQIKTGRQTRHKQIIITNTSLAQARQKLTNTLQKSKD